MIPKHQNSLEKLYSLCVNPLGTCKFWYKVHTVICSFFGTTWAVMLSAGLSFQPHNVVLPDLYIAMKYLLQIYTIVLGVGHKFSG